MLCGETNVPMEPFELLGIGHLASLHAACETLQYKYLANNAFNRIKQLIISQGCNDAYSVAKVCELLPVLVPTLINSIAFFITDLGTPLDSPHVQKLCQFNGLQELLDQAIKKRRAFSINQALLRSRKPNTNNAIICYACLERGHVRKNCLEAQQVDIPRICNNCGKAGHIARYCWSLREAVNPQVQPNDTTFRHVSGRMVRVTSDGEGSTTFDYLFQPGERTRKGPEAQVDSTHSRSVIDEGVGHKIPDQ